MPAASNTTANPQSIHLEVERKEHRILTKMENSGPVETLPKHQSNMQPMPNLEVFYQF